MKCGYFIQGAFFMWRLTRSGARPKGLVILSLLPSRLCASTHHGHGRCQDDDEVVPQDVKHVPRAQSNLISLGELQGLGYFYHVDRDMLTMRIGKNLTKRLWWKSGGPGTTYRRCMCLSFQVELKRIKTRQRHEQSRQPPSPMRMRMLAHTSERNNTMSSIHRCSRGDDDFK